MVVASKQPVKLCHLKITNMSTSVSEQFQEIKKEISEFLASCPGGAKRATFWPTDKKHQAARLGNRYFRENVDYGCGDCLRDAVQSLQGLSDAIEARKEPKTKEPAGVVANIVANMRVAAQKKGMLLAYDRGSLLKQFEALYGIVLPNDRKGHSVMFAVHFIIKNNEMTSTLAGMPVTPAESMQPDENQNQPTVEQFEALRQQLAQAEERLFRQTDEAAKHADESARLHTMIAAETSRADQAVVALEESTKKLEAARRDILKLTKEIEKLTKASEKKE